MLKRTMDVVIVVFCSIGIWVVLNYFNPCDYHSGYDPDRAADSQW